MCVDVKSLIDFNNRQSRCKVCQSEYKRKHYQKNRNHILSKSKKWLIENKDKRRKYLDENSEELAAKSKVYKNKYYKENKEVLNKISSKNYIKNRSIIIAKTYEWKKQRLKNDPLFKFDNNVRALIRNALKKLGYSKKTRTYQILGCSPLDFLNHLNSNPYGFKWGDEGLDLDHIIPLSKAVDEDEIIKLNYYTNFQLLPSEYNRHVKIANDWDKNHFKKWITQNT